MENSKVLKHVKVYTWVKGMISRNQYQIGDKLPTETEIAELFNISRMTVRKALEMLVSEGLLVRTPGKGTFLKSPPSAQLTYNLDNIVSFDAIAQSAKSVASFQTIEQSVVPAFDEVAKHLLIQKDKKVIYTKRLLKSNEKPFMIEKSYFPYPEFRFIKDLDLNTQGFYKSIMEIKPELELNHSTQILTAGLLTNGEKKLLGYPIETEFPCIRQENIIYDRSGVPILLFRATFPGDKFKFTVNSGTYIPELN